MGNKMEFTSGSECYSMDDFDRIEKIDMHLHIKTPFEHTLIKQALKDNFKY